MDNILKDSNCSSTSVKDTNSFIILCDNVASSLLLTHSVVQEVLTFDLQFGKYALPTSMLLNLTLLSSKLHRTISDLTTQVEELIRLVKLFSASWDKRSQAFGKLHKEYNKKRRQMEIALKKLEIVSGRNEQLEKFRILMNWEKMFLKVVGNVHGNLGWRHVIHEYNENVSQGKKVSYLFQNLSKEDAFEDKMTDPSSELIADEHLSPIVSELLESGSFISVADGLADNNEFFDDQSDSDEELKVLSRIESDTIAEWVTSSDVILEYEEFQDEGKDEIMKLTNGEEVTGSDSIPLSLIEPDLGENKLMIDKSTSTSEYNYVFHLQVFRPTSFSEEALSVMVAFNKQLQIGEVFRANQVDYEASLKRELLKSTDLEGDSISKSRGIINIPVQDFFFNVDNYHDSDVEISDVFLDTKLRITLHAGPDKKVIAACSSALRDLTIRYDRMPSEVENVISHHNNNNKLKMVPTTDAGLLKLNQTCGQLFVNCYVTHQKRLWNNVDKATDYINADIHCKSVGIETELKPIYTEDDAFAMRNQFQQQLCDLKKECEQLVAVSVGPEETFDIGTSPISRLSMNEGHINTTFHRPPKVPLSTSTIRKSGRSTKSVSQKWGKDLPGNFFTRLIMFQEASEKYRTQLSNETKKVADNVITKKLQAERKLWDENKKSTFSTDLLLPVVFAPIKGHGSQSRSGRSYVRKDYNLTAAKSGVFPKLESNPISRLSLDAQS